MERERRESEPFVGGAPQAPLSAPRPDARYSLADILKQHEKTFSEYLLDLLKERDGKDSEVYKRAEVSKQLFSKILNNPDYQPTRTGFPQK